MDANLIDFYIKDMTTIKEDDVISRKGTVERILALARYIGGEASAPYITVALFLENKEAFPPVNINSIK